MRDLRAQISNHKKLFCIIGLIFIVWLECCVFPVGNFTFGGGIVIGLLNFVAAIGIGKCFGEIEAMVFPKVTWLLVLLLNLGITIMGMVVRYFLEYGEVSNTYNFTFKNIVVHTVIMLLLSIMFWIKTKRKSK